MIKTILIGLGKVGAIYDHKKKNSTCSHLDVLLKTDRYKVLQLVDKDPKKIELAKKKALNHPSIIIDTKSYDIPRKNRNPLTAGQPLHEMIVKLTIDMNLKIISAEARTESAPYKICKP